MRVETIIEPQKHAELKSAFSEQFEAERVPTLRIFYAIECQNGRSTAQVSFQFESLRGSILAFDLNAKRE